MKSRTKFEFVSYRGQILILIEIDVMEVGKETLSGLLAAADLAVVDDTSYTKLLNYVFSAIQRNVKQPSGAV